MVIFSHLLEKLHVLSSRDDTAKGDIRAVNNNTSAAQSVWKSKKVGHVAFISSIWCTLLKGKG